jgi:hypothetical protein
MAQVVVLLVRAGDQAQTTSLSSGSGVRNQPLDAHLALTGRQFGVLINVPPAILRFQLELVPGGRNNAARKKKRTEVSHSQLRFHGRNALAASKLTSKSSVSHTRANACRTLGSSRVAQQNSL